MGATPPRSIEPWETIVAIQYVDKQNTIQATTSPASSSSRLRLLVLALPSPFIWLCCLCFSLATRPNTSDPVADLCSSLPCSFRRPNHKLIPPPEVVDPAQGTALFSRNTIDHHGDVTISNCRDAAPGRLPKAQNTRWVLAAYHEPISRPDQTEPG